MIKQIYTECIEIEKNKMRWFAQSTNEKQKQKNENKTTKKQRNLGLHIYGVWKSHVQTNHDHTP